MMRAGSGASEPTIGQAEAGRRCAASNPKLITRTAPVDGSARGQHHPRPAAVSPSMHMLLPSKSGDEADSKTTVLRMTQGEPGDQVCPSIASNTR